MGLIIGEIENRKIVPFHRTKPPRQAMRLSRQQGKVGEMANECSYEPVGSFMHVETAFPFDVWLCVVQAWRCSEGRFIRVFGTALQPILPKSLI